LHFFGDIGVQGGRHIDVMSSDVELHIKSPSNRKVPQLQNGQFKSVYLNKRVFGNLIAWLGWQNKVA
jgi:hypothetical protein